MLFRQTGKLSIRIVWHHCDLLQISHTTFSAIHHTGWRNRRVENLKTYSHTPKRTLRLWVTSTHYPSPACTNSLGFSLQISVIYSGLLFQSLPHILHIRHFLTSRLVHILTPVTAFPLYLLQQTTAPLRGSRVLLSAPRAVLQTLPFLTTAMPNVYRTMTMAMLRERKNNLVYLHT